MLSPAVMGRRSDHTPEQLRSLLVEAGHDLMAERGFARFSAREAARRAGYTVGTIYHVFGTLDAYLLAINSVTFRQWAGCLEQALAGVEPQGDDRLAALVIAYFGFAEQHANAWMAIYDHRIDRGAAIAAQDVAAREALTAIVDREVCAWLGVSPDDGTRRLVRSLVATVHGHCALWLCGSFALMQETDPAAQALARVREVLAANSMPA